MRASIVTGKSYQKRKERGRRRKGRRKTSQSQRKGVVKVDVCEDKGEGKLKEGAANDTGHWGAANDTGLGVARPKEEGGKQPISLRLCLKISDQ